MAKKKAEETKFPTEGKKYKVGEEVIFTNVVDRDMYEHLLFGNMLFDHEDKAPFAEFQRVVAILKNGDVVTDTHVFDKTGYVKTGDSPVDGFIVHGSNKEVSELAEQIIFAERMKEIDWTKVPIRYIREFREILREVNDEIRQMEDDEDEYEDNGVAEEAE